MADQQHFGLRIRALRKARSEKQVDLAEAIGVARATITQYEAGIKKPGRDNVAAIASYYGVPIESLLTGSGLPVPVTANDPDEEKAILLMRQVPAHIRAAVLTILENAAIDVGPRTRDAKAKN